MRRVLIRIVVLLALGALLNVAVAWAAVAWAFILRPGDPVQRSGLTTDWPIGVPKDWPIAYGRDWLWSFGYEQGETFSHPHQDPYCSVQFGRAGWPMRSLAWFILDVSWARTGGSEPEKVIGRIILPPVRRLTSYPLPLPARPAPLGFTVNTLFYAALAWLPFAGIPALRRRSRRRRGLCIHCAYPTGTAPVCSECGKPTKAMPRSDSLGRAAATS